MKKSASRVPTRDAAVVIGEVSDALRSRLAEVAQGKVATIPNIDDMLVVEAKPSDPRKLFHKLNEVVGNKAVVAPVLVDDEGHRLFPTGRLQVRFKSQPADDSLAQFAARHRLGSMKRNRWAPQQVEFSVSPDDTRYLPEITEALRADQAVEEAWPDVRAAFRRE